MSGDCQPGPGDACLPCNEKHYSCEKRDDVFAANPEARRAWRQFADFVSVSCARVAPECVANRVQASVDNNNSHITTPGTRGLDPTRPNAGTYPKFSGKAPSRARVSLPFLTHLQLDSTSSAAPSTVLGLPQAAPPPPPNSSAPPVPLRAGPSRPRPRLCSPSPWGRFGVAVPTCSR